MSDKIERCAKCGSEVTEPVGYPNGLMTNCGCEPPINCEVAYCDHLLLVDHWNDRQRLIRAEARIKVLEEALVFYADKNNYIQAIMTVKKVDVENKSITFGDIHTYGLKVLADEGEKARAALSGDSCENKPDADKKLSCQIHKSPCIDPYCIVCEEEHAI